MSRLLSVVAIDSTLRTPSTPGRKSERPRYVQGRLVVEETKIHPAYIQHPMPPAHVHDLCLADPWACWCGWGPLFTLPDSRELAAYEPAARAVGDPLQTPPGGKPPSCSNAGGESNALPRDAGVRDRRGDATRPRGDVIPDTVARRLAGPLGV